MLFAAPNYFQPWMPMPCHHTHRLLNSGRVTHIFVNKLTIIGADQATSHYPNQCCSIVNWTPGTRFTNGFSIAIQIRWKFCFTLTSIFNTVIATKFCTWHDNCAVVACAKCCCDLMASNRTTARRSFHRIWIAGNKPLVKRAPGNKLQWNFNRKSYIVI